jgi:hypothetical protein
MNKKKINIKRFMLEKKLGKILFVFLLLIILVLLILYYTIGIIYNNGNFSVTLDKNLYFDKGLIIYDDKDYKVYRSELLAPSPGSFDNISHRWLPKDIHENEGGSHNGDNYLAYTFYVENTGSDVSDYWTEVVIGDVIRNVDSAVRIRIYKNGEYVTYAKLGANGAPEPDTVPFASEDLVAFAHTPNFKPGDIDKYTLVLWIEGSDPECTDNILGGEFKVEMKFNSEHIDNQSEGEGK